jgi:hypothetical protein
VIPLGDLTLTNDQARVLLRLGRYAEEVRGAVVVWIDPATDHALSVPEALAQCVRGLRHGDVVPGARLDLVRGGRVVWASAQPGAGIEVCALDDLPTWTAGWIARAWWGRVPRD